MQFQFVTSIVLMVVLVGVALAWRSTTVGWQSREPASIKVIVNQVPAASDGFIPIEIVQPTAVSSAPNQLDDLTYFLRNNSAKAVIATSIIKTITYEEGGKIYSHSVYSTMDAALHPDMLGRPFRPGTQMTMESAGPVSFNGAVIIKEITLTFEYVSYDDHTAYGAGGEGERIINAVREGARLYKNWLVREYSRSGKSLTTIFPAIQTQRIPEDLKLGPDQTTGADRYRLHILKTFKTKGAADVESYLKQN